MLERAGRASVTAAVGREWEGEKVSQNPGEPARMREKKSANGDMRERAMQHLGEMERGEKDIIICSLDKNAPYYFALSL